MILTRQRLDIVHLYSKTHAEFFRLTVLSNPTSYITPDMYSADSGQSISLVRGVARTPANKEWHTTLKSQATSYRFHD